MLFFLWFCVPGVCVAESFPSNEPTSLSKTQADVQVAKMTSVCEEAAVQIEDEQEKFDILYDLRRLHVARGDKARAASLTKVLQNVAMQYKFARGTSIGSVSHKAYQLLLASGDEEGANDMAKRMLERTHVPGLDGIDNFSDPIGVFIEEGQDRHIYLALTEVMIEIMEDERKEKEKDQDNDEVTISVRRKEAQTGEIAAAIQAGHFPYASKFSYVAYAWAALGRSSKAVEAMKESGSSGLALNIAAYYDKTNRKNAADEMVAIAIQKAQTTSAENPTDRDRLSMADDIFDVVDWIKKHRPNDDRVDQLYADATERAKAAVGRIVRGGDLVQLHHMNRQTRAVDYGENAEAVVRYFVSSNAYEEIFFHIDNAMAAKSDKLAAQITAAFDDFKSLKSKDRDAAYAIGRLLESYDEYLRQSASTMPAAIVDELEQVSKWQSEYVSEAALVLALKRRIDLEGPEAAAGFLKKHWNANFSLNVDLKFMKFNATLKAASHAFAASKFAAGKALLDTADFRDVPLQISDFAPVMRQYFRNAARPATGSATNTMISLESTLEFLKSKRAASKTVQANIALGAAEGWHQHLQQ